MHMTTQDSFPEFEIANTIGIARGNTVRARHVGKDIIANLRLIVGGEVTEYTKLMAESREQAMDRMIANARQMGADGIVSIRITTAMVMQGSAEILAYGTAVKFK